MSDRGPDVWREAERRNKPKREAMARAMWAETRTPELRALLRQLHPKLHFEDVKRRRSPSRATFPT